jgi:3-hydroxyacyl-CoA dehydrogenase
MTGRAVGAAFRSRWTPRGDSHDVSPNTPRRVIRSIAVLGAGVMGAQIAAHFANAGVPGLLLDITPEAARGTA